MHMDPLAARRTQAGATVVHGVHLVLWALETLLGETREAVVVARINVRFVKFVFVGEQVDLVRLECDDEKIRAHITVKGATAVTLTLGLGTRRDKAPQPEALARVILEPLGQPIDQSFESISGASGRLHFIGQPQSVAGAFPAAAAQLGATRTAALACLSRLVGMVCPGLHSLFTAFKVELVEGTHDYDGIEFTVVAADERFKLVKQRVRGSGISGTVEALQRRPFTSQLSFAEVQPLVSPDEFVGSHALIIGGSRGLGELVAKIVAAGGGRVTVTYRTGKSDAEHVADEIRHGGGVCDVIPFDVRSTPNLRSMRTGRRRICILRDGEDLRA